MRSIALLILCFLPKAPAPKKKVMGAPLIGGALHGKRNQAQLRNMQSWKFDGTIKSYKWDIPRQRVWSLPSYKNEPPWRKKLSAKSLCDQLKYRKQELTNETCVNIGTAWSEIPCCEWNIDMPPGRKCQPNSQLFTPDEWCVIHPRNMGGIIPPIKYDPNVKVGDWSAGYPTKKTVWKEIKVPDIVKVAKKDKLAQVIRNHRTDKEWIKPEGAQKKASNRMGMDEVDLKDIAKTDAPKLLIAQNPSKFSSICSTALIGLTVGGALALASLRLVLHSSDSTSNEEQLLTA